MNTIATATRFRGIIRVALSFAVASLIAIATQPAFAASDSRETGELSVAKNVTVNGTPATGGLTVLSGSHIKTQTDGRAIVNLGKLGRVMLGSEAEIVLKFSDGKLTGEMTSGWAVVSAPKGVEIAINTANGIAAADGDNPSVMRIDLTGGTTRVETQSSAKLTNGQKTEVVAAGEEVEFAAADAGAIAINRRPVDTGSVVEVPGFAEIVTSSVRAAIESVIFERTLAAPSSSTRPVLDLERGEFLSDTRTAQMIEQQVTCGENGIICTPEQQSFGCTIYPIIVKAKAGCTLGFILKSNHPTSSMNVSIRPYMNGACFRLTPTYPQTVSIPPGGTYPAQINARSCPKNAYQYAANKMLVVESDLCGSQYIRVEWATPCI